MLLFCRIALFVLASGVCFFIGHNEIGAAEKDIPNQAVKKKSDLEVWGYVRFRYEKADHFNVLYYGPSPASGKEDDAYTLGKFQFGARYNLSEYIRLSAGMQYAVSWDLAMEDSEFYKPPFEHLNNPYDDYWEPYDTYIEIKKLLPVSLKAGRQTMGYGDKRVFGPGAWGNTGRWIWDAVKLHCPFAVGFFDAYLGQTMLHDPNHLSWAHRSGFKSVGFYSQFVLPEKMLGIAIEPFAMSKANHADTYKGEDGQLGDFNSQYFGARLAKKYDNGFDFDATYVKQVGDSASDDIDAYGYHVMLGYRAKKIPLKPRVSLEYTVASGDSDPTDGDLETFDGAFGGRGTVLGRMNLFYWQNIKDAQINLNLMPMKKLSFTLEYHQFNLAEEKDAWYLNKKLYRDKTGNSGDEVGTELDILGKWGLFKNIELQAGYSHFWPGEFAENLASDQSADWVFVQCSFKFAYGLI
jgi:hypothetical protein